MNQKSFRLFASACLVAVLGLTGCQTAPKIQSEFDVTAGFTAAKTFTVLPLPKNIPGVDPGLILRVGPAATSAASTALKAKGYTETTAAKDADLAVLVHGKVVPKTDVTDWGFTPSYGRAGWYRGYNYGVYGSSNVTVDSYSEGTLIVEIYDVKTSKMIWVGWVEARTSDVKKEEQAAKIGEGVNRILATYPVAGTIPVSAK